MLGTKHPLVMLPDSRSAPQGPHLSERLNDGVHLLRHWVLRQAGDVAVDGHRLLEVWHRQLLLNVLRHVDQHRARTSRLCQVEGLQRTATC